MATPVTDAIQAALDSTAVWRVADGTTAPELPIFIDPQVTLAGSPTVVGTAPGVSVVDASTAGNALIVGWRRGLLDDTYYTQGDGFRTNGDAFLWTRGNEWDLGPAARYSYLSSLSVRFSGLCHAGSWLDGSAPYQVLCGICSRETAVFGPAPLPWLLWWDGPSGGLYFGFKTGDGVQRLALIPCLATTVDLDVTVTLDLAAGTVAASVNGSPVTPDLTLIGPGWQPGLTLIDNKMWPFAAGRGSVVCNNMGFWGTDVGVDMTVRTVALSGSLSAGGSWACSTAFSSPRPAPYSGGPSLPLFPTSTQYGNRWLMGVRRDQGIPDTVGGVVVSNVGFQNGGTQLSLGSVQGGILISNCWFTSHVRGLSVTGLGNCYPLSVVDCHTAFSYDRGLFVYGSAEYAIDRHQFQYANNGCLLTVGGFGAVRSAFHAPGGVVMPSVVDQQGGTLVIESFSSNFEGAGEFPPLLSVALIDWSTESRPVETFATSLGNGTGELLVTLPNWTGNAHLDPNGVSVHLDGRPVPPTPRPANIRKVNRVPWASNVFYPPGPM